MTARKLAPLAKDVPPFVLSLLMVRSTSDLHGNVRAERSKDEERNTSLHRVEACRIRCRKSGTCRTARVETPALSSGFASRNQ